MAYRGAGGKIMTQETNQNEVVVQNNAVAKRNDGELYFSNFRRNKAGIR